MPLLKLSIPGLRGSPYGREDINIDISESSLAAWYESICPPQLNRKESRVISGIDDLVSPELRDPVPMAEVKTLLERAGENGESDEEALRLRHEAYEILDGSRRSIPNHKYEGVLAPEFTRMAVYELKQRALDRSLRLARSEQPRGWRCLHRALIQGIFWDASDFPLWSEQQRAYLLTVEEMNGFWAVKNMLNLDTCSMPKLRERMEGVAERGWRDVIWITENKEDLPRRLKKEDSTKTIEWSASTEKGAKQRGCCAVQ